MKEEQQSVCQSRRKTGKVDTEYLLPGSETTCDDLGRTSDAYFSDPHTSRTSVQQTVTEANGLFFDLISTAPTGGSHAVQPLSVRQAE
jgi:hypothetical protein